MTLELKKSFRRGANKYICKLILTKIAPPTENGRASPYFCYPLVALVLPWKNCVKWVCE